MSRLFCFFCPVWPVNLPFWVHHLVHFELGLFYFKAGQVAYIYAKSAEKSLWLRPEAIIAHFLVIFCTTSHGPYVRYFGQKSSKIGEKATFSSFFVNFCASHFQFTLRQIRLSSHLRIQLTLHLRICGSNHIHKLHMDTQVGFISFLYMYAKTG